MMNETITCQIEQIDYDELLGFMRQQAEDAFPALKDEEHLLAFSKKLYTHAELCLCRDNGKLVGMIAFYANGQGADFAYITHVYVSPKYRGWGLFAKMLQVMEKFVMKRGFAEIKLEVDNDNLRAQKAYIKQSFKIDSSANLNSKYMVKKLWKEYDGM